MTTTFTKYLAKLFFKQWTIGICKGDLGEIIRSRSFDPEIKWLYLNAFDRFIADPFFVRSDDGNIKILIEELFFRENYGKISLLTLDGSLRELNRKQLLDTGSHLSYPFVFYENDRIYIFPEASRSGRLSAYEFDQLTESLTYLCDIIDMPLKDSTIVKQGGKYWLFGIVARGDVEYKLHIFYADSLLGPYTPHKRNPVANSLRGTRPAGNFVLVDGVLYRPAQDCEKAYGESMVINRITRLDEEDFAEEPYLVIRIDRNDPGNRSIHTIHTINQQGDLLVVDGEQWSFAPVTQLKKFIGDIPLVKKLSGPKIKSVSRY